MKTEFILCKVHDSDKTVVALEVLIFLGPLLNDCYETDLVLLYH